MAGGVGEQQFAGCCDGAAVFGRRQHVGQCAAAGMMKMDVVRGGNYRPVSPARDGSFFAIPVPWGKKPHNQHNDDEDQDVDDDD